MIIDIILLAAILYLGYTLFKLTENPKRNLDEDVDPDLTPDVDDTTQEK